MGKLLLHVIMQPDFYQQHLLLLNTEILLVSSLKLGYQYLDYLLNSLVIMVVNLVTMTLMTCESHQLLKNSSRITVLKWTP